MIEKINIILETLVGWVWGVPLIVLLFGTHIFLTVRTGFVQRHLRHALNLSVTRDGKSKGDVSRFGALVTAMAATLGTGNIYGVAVAVIAGGPGAVFWMWLTGVFGMASRYSESLLSIKYRVTNERGQMSGGPMYVLERAFKARWAALLFALFTALAAFGIGNTAQSNTITELVIAMSQKYFLPIETNHDVFATVIGLVLALLTGAVILGGIRSIARFCELLVPFMAALYILGCLVILALDWRNIIPTIEVIVKAAFTGQSAVGGFLGVAVAQAMRHGIARGLFSNEAGMGSGAIVDAAAKTDDPVKQALVSSTGVFWSVVVCTLTGLVIVGSGEWQVGFSRGQQALLCGNAFHHYLGVWGDGILVFGLVTFAFSTLIGWSYYGEKSIEYLAGIRAVVYYRWVWVALAFVGAVWKSDAVWNFSDMMNGLMAIPNLVALLLLNGIIAAETKRYFSGISK